MIVYDRNKPLFSLHVAKCGGASISRLLNHFYGERLRQHYIGPGDVLPPRYDPGPGICIHGHFEDAKGTGVFDYYPQAEQFITTLRDPFEIHVSWYHYAKRLKNNPITREKNPWLKNVADDVNEYIEMIIEKINTDPGPSEIGGMLESMPCELTLDNFETYLDNNFVHIGIVEDLQASAVSLARRLGVYPRQITISNKSHHDETPKPELRDEYRRTHELEYAVYDYAVRHHAPPEATKYFLFKSPAKISGAEASISRSLSSDQLEIELRGSCNLACSWCGLSERGSSPAFNAQSEKAVDMIRQASEMGGAEVAFGRKGPEPTTDPALPDLMALAKRSGLSRITLYTNGITLSDQAFLKHLRDMGLTEVVMSALNLHHGLCDALVGLQGANADRIRAIENLVSEQVPVTVCLLFLRPVLRGMPEMTEYLSRLAAGFDGLRFAGLMPYPGFLFCKHIFFKDSLWPPLGELKRTLERIRETTPDFFLAAPEMPLCFAKRLGDNPVLLIDNAQLAFDFDDPPVTCDSCPVRGYCTRPRDLFPATLDPAY